MDFERGSLFTRSSYLDPLEHCGCASPAAGWTPAHVETAAGRAPAYLKMHSWGEFVFDFALARAYEQHGLRYYPKLVCSVPFTPVPGPRLLAADHTGRRKLADALIGRARERKCSGAHVLFCTKDEADLLADAGWLTRVQPRYLWRNGGYADFETFLSTLNSKQRKNIRRERRGIVESGLDIRWQSAEELDARDWPQLFRLYASTYAMRGQDAYLNLDCLRQWGENFPRALRFCIARDRGEPVAMAFFFEEGDALYGRHWGASVQLSGLHFELCYYRGIEWCIERGLQLFDAGVQGEHKLARGFAEELAHSAHWFAHDALRAPIRAWFEQERRALAAVS
ncbi:MAG TPA: GNAT family N-acetyltransferase [Nevskiaceae bacterium]|nr:GNAT family N-acetyltransferase [Nevskiaceae bacterium]